MSNVANLCGASNKAAESLTMSDADAEDVLIAIEEAMGCIVEQYAVPNQQGQDGDGALRVLHRLHVANLHMKKATGQVLP